MDNEHERQLHAELVRLNSFYGNLQISLDGLVKGGGQLPPQRELQCVLQSVKSNQTTYQAVMDCWNRSGFVPSKRCEQLRSEVAGLLAQLLKQISLLENQAAKARDNMLPQLNQVALDRQAVAAYGRNSQA